MFKDTDDYMIPYHYSGFCWFECGVNDDKYINIEKRIDANLYKGQWSDRVQFFKESPCINCLYKRHEYKYIYDMAFGREGVWTLAVEIKHTHPVNKEKIINTPFPIFEIDAEWVLRQTKIPEFLKGEWL